MASTMVDWKFITFFTYHLDVFESFQRVIVRSFRRLNKYSFNITIVIRVPIDSIEEAGGYAEFIEETVEKIYSDYVKSDRFKREKYEDVNQMVHDLYSKYPNLR